MLTKLMKYEWKDTKAVGLICNGVILALAVIGVILFSLDIWSESASRSDTAQAFTEMTLSLYFVVLVWGIIAACMVVRYYFFYRYYKNLFTDQGYLMNTLPVKSTELLNAKLIIAAIWQYITALIVAGSIILMICVLIAVSTGDWYSLYDFSAEMRELFNAALADVVLSVLPMLISCFIYILIAPIGSMLLSYTAVCLGQTSKKHKLLVSVLILVGFFIVIEAVVSYATLPFTLMMESSMPSETVLNVIAVLLLLLYIGAIIGMYFLNKYFLEKKLNLE